jgi:WhiB family redox-sensing transcriptional regulator
VIEPQYLPPAWTKQARCAETDPEIFFPEPGDSSNLAQKICAMCEVKTECLEYALDNNERYGIWGGLSESKRRPLLKARGLAC